MTAKELKEKLIRKWGYEFIGPNNGNFKPAFTDLESDINKLSEQLCKEQREICARGTMLNRPKILNAKLPKL